MSNHIIEELKKMLAEDPDDVLGHYMLGRELLKIGQPQQAIAPLRRVIELDPDYTAAYRQLGDAYRSANRREEAIETYKQGVEVSEKTRDYQTGKECAAFLKKLSQ